MDDFDEKNTKPTLKENMANFLDNSLVDNTIEFFNLTLGIISMLGYLISTYNVWKFEEELWGIFSFSSRAFFVLEYLLRLYTSEVRKNYLF